LSESCSKIGDVPKSPVLARNNPKVTQPRVVNGPTLLTGTVISQIEADDDKVRIIGDKPILAAVIAGRQNQTAQVRGFVRKWRARRDSNSRPLPSEDCGSRVGAAIYGVRCCAITWNGTTTSGDYADILRTPSDVLAASRW
jgi:hypothetical protein